MLPADHDPSLDLVETCEYLNITEAQLRKHVFKGIAPDYYKVGRLIRFKRSSLDAYVEANTVRRGAET